MGKISPTRKKVWAMGILCSWIPSGGRAQLFKLLRGFISATLTVVKNRWTGKTKRALCRDGGGELESTLKVPSSSSAAY